MNALTLWRKEKINTMFTLINKKNNDYTKKEREKIDTLVCVHSEAYLFQYTYEEIGKVLRMIIEKIFKADFDNKYIITSIPAGLSLQNRNPTFHIMMTKKTPTIKDIATSLLLNLIIELKLEVDKIKKCDKCTNYFYQLTTLEKKYCSSRCSNAARQQTYYYKNKKK